MKGKSILLGSAIIIALSLILSAFAISMLSYNVPATVTIRKTTVSNIAYQLYNASDNTPIYTLNFGTIEPGSSTWVQLYLRSPNTTQGYVYVSWQTSELLPYMNLTAYYGPMGDAYTWNQTERRQWLLSTDLKFMLILQTDLNAPAIDNVHFTLSFTLYNTP